MKVAAIQMQARLAEVDSNLEKAANLMETAFKKGCKIVILPEFFPSAAAFHPRMLRVALPFHGPALALLKDAARRFNGYAGGSFITSRDGHNYNTFVLTFPDGSYATHDKDLPTMWENCYYRGGSDEGILDTPFGPVGALLCWEMTRTQTAKRLRGRVDLLVGGSCWWTLPEGVPLPGGRGARQRNFEIMSELPSLMARLLGVPFIHAAHAGDFVSQTPWVPGVPYKSHYLGETQVVDATGKVLTRLSRDKGDGLAIAEIEPGRVNPTAEIPPGYWIPRFPLLLRAAWSYQNRHGKRFYRQARRSGKLLINRD
ncbi:MAG TPA: carbon-nitrogen hydrolase family protein [Bacillota bacterium]|jgi:predicted amidohydrolase|nr:carbon-nitrogen hydrolase family protein [Bacillota bacterium]NMD33561.1 carbon-nitrogen hydrolase family protein [Bacillota bacterium]HOB29161.1 carbon-nitrogen hydrolase family protein [Bacillota bacterium]HPZ41773.1 carbon-nitrogen hydrolase family protein [Bacillota bacterium]HQD52583.1 carbon-nitrogen hydrolase family protein [Bacillota bacterium]